MQNRICQPCRCANRPRDTVLSGLPDLRGSAWQNPAQRSLTWPEWHAVALGECFAGASECPRIILGLQFGTAHKSTDLPRRIYTYIFIYIMYIYIQLNTHKIGVCHKQAQASNATLSFTLSEMKSNQLKSVQQHAMYNCSCMVLRIVISHLPPHRVKSELRSLARRCLLRKADRCLWLDAGVGIDASPHSEAQFSEQLHIVVV